MAKTQAILALVVSWCLAAASTQLVCAQIINASIPQSDGGVKQATGDFDDAELAGGIEQTGWPSIGWPKVTLPTITMPKITMPKLTMPKLPPLWPSQSNGQSPALLAPFAAGFSKVSAGTKKAWEGTKELFSVAGGNSATKSSVSQATQPRPSFWERLVGRPQEPQVPQTVGEFMSQKRLDP